MKKNLRALKFLSVLVAIQALGISAAFSADPIPYPSKPPLAVGTEKEFWVWDLNVMPPSFRKAKLTLREVGKRSYIYVEDKFWQRPIDQEMLDRFLERLEKKSPTGAVLPDYGIIPLEEALFAALPSKINPDERLNILFADLGKYKNYEFDGFFNAYDQMKDSDSWKDAQQHSNEANIIYINGLRQSEDYTLGVISHELQHLLAYHAVPDQDPFQQDLWLSETLAEGAMLLNGYYGDQGHVNTYAQNTAAYPLVSESYVQYGSQLLFSSFLIDNISNYGGLGELTRAGIKGRDAVEALFQHQTSAPISFDALYSNFIAYIYNAAQKTELLPKIWHASGSALNVFGLRVPAITSAATITALPSVNEGILLPYTFLTFDLAKELPQDSLVKVELLPHPNDSNPTKECSKGEVPLWKPLSTKTIAVYSIGCEHKDKNDAIRFRLSIFEKPSIFLPNPAPFRLAF